MRDFLDREVPKHLVDDFDSRWEQVQILAELGQVQQSLQDFIDMMNDIINHPNAEETDRDLAKVMYGKAVQTLLAFKLRGG